MTMDSLPDSDPGQDGLARAVPRWWRKISAATFLGTLCAGAAAMTVTVLTLALNLELFERFVAMMVTLERYEVDEFIIPVLLVLMGIAVDGARAVIAGAREQVRLDTYNAMNRELAGELSMQLTRLLNLRALIVKGDTANEEATRIEIEKLVRKAYRQLGRIERRMDIDSDFVGLLLPPDRSRFCA